MAGRSTDGSESRFAAYVRGLVSVIGHADRAGPLHDYCLGLIMPGERKSVEPMAAVTAPERTAAQHQSLLHFVGKSSWSDEKVLTKVGETVLPAIESHGPIEAWIIDDTGFPKQGKHSIGVARPYCGQLGKQDNCQVAVSLSLANHHASLPVAWHLYLPKEWASDEERRRKAGVPEEIEFRTKPQIALEQIEAACEAGLPRGVVLMDAGYGCKTQLRAGVSALALTYVAGIFPNTTVWTSDTEPPPPKKWSGRGRRAKRLRRDANRRVGQNKWLPIRRGAAQPTPSPAPEGSWRCRERSLSPAEVSIPTFVEPSQTRLVAACPVHIAVPAQSDRTAPPSAPRSLGRGLREPFSLCRRVPVSGFWRCRTSNRNRLSRQIAPPLLPASSSPARAGAQCRARRPR